ncbi:PAS domain-containing protein [Hymenobacter sp. RP-2-7]|uniref:Sensory/regulatory protein RpfC n=1 Tax=Hymenobacter polaris TaxID=2682546 RepID=A0A7Y0AAL0_9BACT|nr:ATP-binding protein [Hymenobacter polaris]NML63799.1 PAS domain-containing protein [Hymenobacter polaris]
MPLIFAEPAAPLPAEAELQALRLLADLNPHPVLRFDAQGQQLYANQAARQLLGGLAPAQQALVSERLSAALLAGGSPLIEVGERFFRGQAVASVPPAGSLTLYLVEITEQVLAERQLAEQRSLIEQILDTTPNPVFVRNAQAEIVFANRASVELRSQTSHLHPTHAQPATPPLAQEIASYQANDAHVLATGEQLTSEGPVTLATGEQRWFRTVRRLLVRPDGERQVLGISTDITAQRVAVRGLELRDQQYRDLMAHSQALIFTHDLAGKLLSVNPAGAALVGCPAEAMVGVHLAEGALPAYRAEVAAYLQQVATQGGHQGVMALAPPGHEKPRYVLYHTHLVREESQAPYVVGYGQDITERIEAERALKQAKNAAEAAVKARENFLANMSHEIRTPLNGVLGMAGQLARTALDSRQQEFLSTIRHAGQHLLHIINDVLDMAKITSGKLELESQPFNLCDSMYECLQPLVAQAQEKGIEVTGTRLQKSCPQPWVLGDAYRLNQILLNLVANAIKFTEPGGRIVIVGQLLAETEATITVRFSVADTGIGIAYDKQEAIFDGFTQAYADTTRRYGGTGLGLSISRALVEQLGGSLRLSSEPGLGSTFAFVLTLPKAPSPLAPAPTAPYDTGALRGRRVLVVEDNEINRTVARLLLEDWGVVVEEAEDGRAGVDRVRDDAPYDLVLMDIQLPVLNGLDATAAIRALPDAERAQVPIVALTANVFKSDRDHYLGAGMQACLSKPFEEEDVYRTLLRVLPTPRSFDLTRLRQMARGREEFVVKIIRSFLRNMPGSLAALRQAMDSANWTEAAKITHHIKPSLESLGLVDVADAVRLLEAAPADSHAALRAAALRLLMQGELALAELPHELPGGIRS